jgi:hypothetical protein
MGLLRLLHPPWYHDVMRNARTAYCLLLPAVAVLVAGTVPSEIFLLEASCMANFSILLHVIVMSSHEQMKMTRRRA